MKSCIYRGVVRHRRREPVRHAFSYDLYMMYLDLGELSEIFRGRWLWSTRGRAPVWFNRADYLGDPSVPLDETVREVAEGLTGRVPGGPIRVLTHLRTLGYLFNPVTFYYCFAPRGGVEMVLAEITNTPWGERHVYALTPDTRGEGPCGQTHRFAKSFHVSPFMSMAQQYAWRFSEPGERLRVHMENREGGRKLFEASLVLVRQEISGASLSRALLRHPWMTARVTLGIYWQAIRLRMKGTPYHEHPRESAA